jgi:plastocyanin
MSFESTTRRRFATGLALAALAFATMAPASAQEASYAITIRDGRFDPSTLNVKAGVKFKLTVTNATAKSAEFESAELNREKVIPAGTSGSLYIGPLEPGTYPFFDDFNQSNRGQIVAK